MSPDPFSAGPVLHIANVVRPYQALRPIRVKALTLAEGERVAITGVDAAGAEVLVNLVTGAALPAEGEVRVFGRATSEIRSGDEWLASLDRFGIVSPRAVLMEGATVQQNLAMPFTLQIDPVPDDVAGRVGALAAECGIAEGLLGLPAGSLEMEIRARVHFARAIALDPALVLIEHPTVGIGRSDASSLAQQIAQVLEQRGVTALLITADESFAVRAASRVLRLQPATGELKPVGRGWFR